MARRRVHGTKQPMSVRTIAAEDSRITVCPHTDAGHGPRACSRSRSRRQSGTVPPRAGADTAPPRRHPTVASGPSTGAARPGCNCKYSVRHVCSSLSLSRDMTSRLAGGRTQRLGRWGRVTPQGPGARRRADAPRFARHQAEAQRAWPTPPPVLGPAVPIPTHPPARRWIHA